jgi:16S rRNA G966 N2-methylase RsmD
MNDIERIRARRVAQFDPTKTKEVQAKVDSIVAFARRIKDWDLLREAVDVKLEDQREHVRWWDETVRDAGQPEKNCITTDTILSADEAARETGISKLVVSRWRNGLADESAYRERMYGRAYAAGMGLDRKAAKAWMRGSKAARALPQGDCTLICADIADVEIEPGSIDIILTDPPYPEEYLGVYETLARRSSDWLKEGGSLLCMCGQSFLPDIMASMVRHMPYQWTLAYLTPGGQATQLWQRKVNTFWKPVLWFVNGEHHGDWIGDVAKSDPNDNDKRFHGWGQSESGIADLLDRFAEPGQTVFDPFVGGGTTAVVALKMGMRFIGADIDQAAIDRLRTIA